MDELTLLSERQIWGNYCGPRLDVLGRYGFKAFLTDVAILTGADVRDSTFKDGRIGTLWTTSRDLFWNGYVMIMDGGSKACAYGYTRYHTVRPVLKSPSIFSQISRNRVKLEGYKNTEEVEYGEYPQMAADANMQKILEDAYQKGMKKTGKTYTFDSRKHGSFLPVVYDEYEHQGKKYIRIKANFYGERAHLYNGLEYKNGDYVWVEVQPVKWLIDDKSGLLIAKKGLVSGIRYHNRFTKYKGDFCKTEMYTFLNQILIKDLIPSKIQSINYDAQDDEINKLITKIQKLVEPLADSKEKEILSIMEKLISQYKQDMQTLQPDINFVDEDISLDSKPNLNTLKSKLIAQLNGIIYSLHNNERLLALIDKINQYQKLIKQQVEMPTNTDTIENKISYMVAVSQSLHNDEITKELTNLLNQISKKVSDKMSQLVKDNYVLTLESEVDVQNIFSKAIENMFMVVSRYYTIQMSLQGIGDTELASDIHKMLSLFATLGAENQFTENQINLQLLIDKLKEKYNLDVCMNNTIESITLSIRKELQPMLEEFNMIYGAVEEVKNEILKLLEDSSIPEPVRIKSKQKLANVLAKWKEKLASEEDIENIPEYYENLDKNTARKLLFLRDLSQIKYSLESYIQDKIKYDQATRSL